MLRFPRQVTLVDVGPRDGLQNEALCLPTAEKVALIDRLAAAGLKRIEVGSFVSPRWVPQMADTADVLAAIARPVGVKFSVLAPNRLGVEAAINARADEVAIFAAASETFSRRNVNASIAEALQRFEDACAAAARYGLPVRGYVSCVLGCPYEGEIAPAAVATVARHLADLGCYEISLGDTIGVGTARRVYTLLEAVAREVPPERLAAHFHDTYGQALANILAALDFGLTVVDSATAGLGGCPYARGAAGNVATEDVLFMLNGLGIETGVDLDQVYLAGAGVCAALGRPPVSKVALAMSRRGAPTHH
ncbi:MAG: hydroxymethylglutaryl-CoA lyase [Rhodospirillales bacterium]|nr:hydroxymethylglutaryl-CoA lyase [Rhodospirillales bacterium]